GIMRTSSKSPRWAGAGGLRAAGLLALSATLALACARHENASGPMPMRGPQVVRDMVAAHGGMKPWRTAPTVSFEDEFQRAGQPAQASRVVVEQSRRRVYIDMADGARLCWDGTKAWSTNWRSPVPPRFLALLNYYFLDLPWLTQDPGVKLGEPGTG